MKSSELWFSEEITRSIEDIDQLVYGKFVEVDVGKENQKNDEYSIHVSLINQYMFRADQYYFGKYLESDEYVVDISESDERIFEGYHPYFYEFTAHSEDRKVIKFVKENIGNWMPMKLLDQDATAESTEYEYKIEGIMFFGASPLKIEKKELVFNASVKSDPIVKKIESFYDSKNKNQNKTNLLKLTKHCYGKNNIVLNDFNKLLPSKITSIYGTVYNVGQANNIKLIFKSGMKKVTVLYDIGKTFQNVDKTNPDINSNVASFKKEKFDAVILSHWDLDHICGIEHYDDKILYSSDRIWIAPDINLLRPREISASAFRLASYLAYKSRLYLAHKSLGSNLNVGNDVLEIWQGDGIQHNGTLPGTVEATHSNVIGLLVELKRKKFKGLWITGYNSKGAFKKRYAAKEVLLCGDCTFRSIPTALKSGDYALIVTPHHGTDTTKPDINVTFGATAIISAGRVDNKRYSYPGKGHVYELIKCGFSVVLLTEKYKKITFKLFI